MEKIISVIMVVLGLATITGCDKGNEAETLKPYATDGFEIVKGFNVEDREVFEIVDPDTGVHYLVVTDTLTNNSGSAITPLYNEDGTLKVD